MSEIQIIQETLQQTARRRRSQRAWRGLWQGLFIGASLWLVVLGLYKLAPIPELTLTVAAAVSLALLPVGFLVGWSRKPSLAETARWVDGEQHFQERLSTALEVAGSPATGDWRGLLLTDAAGHARRFNPRKSLPYHLPLITRWALLALVLAATLGFVPEYRSKAYLQKQKQAEIIRDTGRQLAELTRRALEHRPPVMEPTRKSLESVTQLGDHLAKVKLEKSDALRDLASVTERLKDQAKQFGKDPAIRRMEQAARTPGGQTSMSNAELQKQIETLQKELGSKAGNPDAVDKLKQDLKKLQQAASGLPNQDGASQQMKDQLSQTLSDLAKKAEAMGLSLPNLEDAIKALEGGQIDKFLTDLKLAEIDLDKMAAMAKAMQQLQLQLEQLGKDLAEQLEKGQAFVAQATLQKMIKQLQSSELNQEQLKKILEEVDKAVKPGSEYGKVGEYLKQAVQQMQQSDKPNAAQSLADASKELERLMKQMGDCDSLLATLQACQKAQMCIGNCQGWGMCQGPPRVGKGGRPGRGVGTWSDDDGSITSAENTGLWDNSGLQRPDMDSRGLTDRGDGALNPALTPTKVKGQISPGGQMPSITLKGVSIKGQSTVAYQEAVTAAQSQAQSALSQEQVPRAYQGAVKDYFDDLKE